MEDVLRPLVVVGGAVAVTLAIGWFTDQALRRTDALHHETPLWGLLRRCRLPLQMTVCAGLLRGFYDQTGTDFTAAHDRAVAQCLTLVLIASAAWLAVRISAAVVESSYSRYAAGAHDPARVRRVRTQVTLTQRVVSAVVGVVAVSAMLLTFPTMRTVGTSMLASAGILGIVAGVAAQSTLGNLFAGLQIAFGDMVRIGDTVVVDGEWGTVEEITLTFLSVRTWDERRITMPVSYFTNKPFENWSRGGPEKTGTVMFHLDHSAPIPAMRAKLKEIVRECAAWDGRDWNLVVTDTTPSTIQVRALVTARDSGDAWDARCEVRERMIAWLSEEHPYALPRIPMAPAPGSPEDPEDRPAASDGKDAGADPGRGGDDGARAGRSGRDYLDGEHHKDGPPRRAADRADRSAKAQAAHVKQA